MEYPRLTASPKSASSALNSARALFVGTEALLIAGLAALMAPGCFEALAAALPGIAAASSAAALPASWT